MLFRSYFDNTWYYQTSTPWVRLNFDPTIGLNEETSSISALVYPNPANEAINVKFDAKSATSGVVRIYSNTGNLVSALDFSANAGVSTETIDVSALSTGMYTVKITTEEGVATRKFFKK